MNMERNDTKSGSLIANMAIGTAVHLNDIEGGKKCRLCGSTENQEDLIKPCLCDGDRRYVHRRCLNRERALSTAPKAFTHCSTCQYEYWLRQEKEPDAEGTDECCNPKKHFKRADILIARDSIGTILFIQLALMGFAWLIAILDNGFQRIVPEDCCPQTQYNFYTWDTKNAQCPGMCGQLGAPGGGLLNSLPPGIAQHTKTAYYIWAVFITWVILASFGVLRLLAMDKEERGKEIGTGFASLFCCCWCVECCCTKEEQERRHIFGGANVYGERNSCGGGNSCGGNSNCNCGGSGNCNCSGGGEAFVVLLVVAAIIMLIFIFLSFFMGFLIMFGIGFKIFQNHVNIIKRKELAKEFVVQDCDHIQLAPDADGRALLPPDYDDTSLREFNIM